MAAPRIQIQDVRPQVDCGRYPVKACLGDAVAVVGDDLPRRPRAARGRRPLPARRERASWREARLESKGNDRFETTLVPDALGPWELCVQAWVDPYASWLDEHDRKVGGGSGRPGRRALGGGAAVRRRRRRRLARRRAALSDRKRHAAAKSSVLRIDVDRERARFGAWYELFPRSWGGFRGRREGAARPRGPRLRRRLPAARAPDRRDLPQGPQQRRGRAEGDPGSPWAIGGAAGGHDALHPDLGSEDDFEAMVAAAREAGIEIALDFAIQCSPDHPWLQRAPGLVQPPPRRHDQVRREPAQALPGHPQRRLGLRGARALWQALLDVVLGWCARGVLVFRVDNPHTKPMPFWEWLIAEVRAVAPRGDLPLRGIHAPRADDDAREDRLLAVVHVLHLEEHEGRAGRVRRAGARRGRRSTGRTCGRTRRTSSTSTCRKAGAPAFEARLVLAATLSPSYGIYSGYEACENMPVRGGQRGVPRLGEVRGQAALAAGAAAAADPPPERDPARPSGTAAVREPAPGSRRTARS